MSITSKILGFSVPPTVVDEVKTMAKEERRTKSEFFREMVRVYRRYRDQRDRDDERWVMNIIRQAKEEQAKTPMSTAEMLRENERLARYGAQQAKRLGLKTSTAAINRIIHERRKTRTSS